MVVLALSAAACTNDSPTGLTNRDKPLNVITSNASKTNVAETDAVALIARALAMTLGNPSARQRIEADLRDRGLGHEHKVLVRSYLSDRNAASIASLVAATAGLSSDSLSAVVNAVRQMELYMPVRAQRITWTGEQPVLVAYQLEKHGPITAYDAQGGTRTLSESAPPPDYVIAIVPRELSAADSVASTAAQASRTRLGPMQRNADVTDCGTLIIPDPSCSDGGDTGEVPVPDADGDGVPNAEPTGLYMTYSNLVDAMEPWIRGDPEVEVHVMGPSVSDPSNTMRDISCASASSQIPRNFDQNGNTWTGYVMLLNEQEFGQNKFVDSLTDARHLGVVMYEDDDQVCVIQDDPSRVTNLLEQLGAWGVTGYLVAEACQQNTVGGTECGLGIWGTIFAVVSVVWHLFDSNDDFLGMAVQKAQVPGFNDPNATHALILNASTMQQNGGIKLVYHNYGT